MNRIVREHYPADRLPDDLRQELGLVQTVTITIAADEATSREEARSAAIADILEHRKRLQPSAPDAVERVRKLRDEWDH